MLLKLAMRIIRRELRRDEGYYRGWQSNIAMAIYDECKRKGLVNTKQEGTEKSLHRIANQGAKNFLDLLIRN